MTDNKLTFQPEVSELKALGNTVRHPSSEIEIFESPSRRSGIDSNTEILIETEEFTCLCPKTGQPDFALFKFRYTPRDWCVESKSLKLYLWSFRDRKQFHEAVTEEILHTICSMMKPKTACLEMRFLRRGGLDFTVTSYYHEEKNDPEKWQKAEVLGEKSEG